MTFSPRVRATKIIEGVRKDLVAHADTCGDRVLGLALSPADHAQLQLAELWGLPVLAWTEVEDGRYRLLCEAVGTLIPQLDTADELLDYWACHLQPPPQEDDSQPQVA